MSNDKEIRILDTANDISKLIWLNALNIDESCSVLGLVIKAIAKGHGDESIVPDISSRVDWYARFYSGKNF